MKFVSLIAIIRDWTTSSLRTTISLLSPRVSNIVILVTIGRVVFRGISLGFCEVIWRLLCSLSQSICRTSPWSVTTTLDLRIDSNAAIVAVDCCIYCSLLIVSAFLTFAVITLHTGALSSDRIFADISFTIFKLFTTMGRKSYIPGPGVVRPFTFI